MPRIQIFILTLIVLLCCASCSSSNFLNEYSSSSLHKSGLTVSPDESAAEILLRAHRGDHQAIALVMAGYFYGIGGFPQDRQLAFDWAFRSSDLKLEAHNLFIVMHLHWTEPNPKNASPLMRSLCQELPQDYLVPLYKDAGIFDLEAVCSVWNTLPLYKDDHQTAAGVDVKPWRDDIRKYYRHPDSAPLKRELQVANLTSRSYEALFLSIAGTHEDEAQPFNRDDARLLEFSQALGPSSNALKTTWTNLLLMEVQRELTSFSEVSDIIELIARAHSGDLPAMRRMADSYVYGAFGFPQDRVLAVDWSERAAMRGDAAAMLSCAVWFFRNEGALGMSESYKWAALAEAYGDDRIRLMAAKIQHLAEKGLTEADLEDIQTDIQKTKAEIETAKAALKG